MLIPTAILFNLLSRFEFIIYLTHDYVFGTFRVVVAIETPYSTGNLHKKNKVCTFELLVEKFFIIMKELEGEDVSSFNFFHNKAIAPGEK